MQAAFSAVDNDDILNVSFDNLPRRSTDNFEQAIEEAAEEAVAEAGNGSQIHQRTTMEGPLTLALGADDIFWMSKLHTGLLEVRTAVTGNKCTQWRGLGDAKFLRRSPRIVQTISDCSCESVSFPALNLLRPL